MKIIIILFSLLLSAINICNGQTASLQITSDTDAMVEIFAPIDGAFQTIFLTDKFQVSPKQTVIYKTDVKEYSCLQIKINNTRCCVWVFPGDSITIGYGNERLAFKGSNAPGHRYYYMNWIGTMWFVNNLRSLVLSTEDYSGIEQKFIEKFVNPATEEMERFLPADSVSAQFAGVLKRDIIDYQYGELWKSLREIHYNKRLTDEQTAQINGVISRINERFSGYEDGISQRFFLGSAYLDLKYGYMFDQLSNVEKTALSGNYPSKAFGPYAYLLLAPVNVQIASLFNAVILDNKYGSMGFEPIDVPVIIRYMQSIAPESEGLEILKKIEQEKQAKTVADDPAIFIETSVDSLSGISGLPGIKGNYCFIDIWATWCVPCLQQFQYAEEMHKLISGYDNLKLVYITIDELSAEQKWKETIRKFNLGGLHIMANPQLQEDIVSKVYGDTAKKTISIPRYLLLSPSGEIICRDMPRPDNLKKVEEMLNTMLKN